jgi:hypothetical protein
MNQEEPQKPTQPSSAKEATMELLRKAGIKYVQKQGSILMPLSKNQEQSINKSKDSKYP